jgi:outer membrane murein-binding lipoprotein Lpp
MKKKIVMLISSVLVILSLTGCASWGRFTKNISSDVGNGLNRKVTVYTQDGKEIRTYEGNIDVQDTQYGNKVLFDLNGKRVILYNAVVVVEEK